MRALCRSKLNHSVGNGDNSSQSLLILIFLTCGSDFETMESAHSERLIRSSKRQAPQEGCAVKLYGAVMDTVLKLGVAAPDRPWSVNRVVTALLPPPTPLLSLPVVLAGLPQETNPTTRTRTGTNIATPLAASA
jgi:hypothetical protein